MTENRRLTNIDSIANACIDALCKVYNRDTKESIFNGISPGKLFSLYFPKPNTTSTTNTNNTSSDQQQLQNNSLVCIGAPNEQHSNTQPLQNNNLDSTPTKPTKKRKKSSYTYQSKVLKTIKILNLIILIETM